MTTLEWYIFRQLLAPLGFFTLVLTGVIWLTQSLRVIDTVVNNGQGAQVFLEFTALLLPTVLSIVLQLAALAATVFTLNRLATESELVAAFAGGASKMRVGRPVVVFGVGLMAMLAVDTIYLMPTSARIMRDRVAEVRGDIAAGLIRDGRFMHPARGLTVYIREISTRGELRGLLVHDAADRSQPITFIAASGFLTRNQADQPVLVMFDGQLQRVEPDGERLSMIRFDSFEYSLEKYITNPDDRRRKPSERYFWELIDPDPDEARSERARGKFVAEGHEQLSAPLYALALPLVAAAAMLSAGFSRRGLGGRIALALALGAGLRVCGLAAKSAVTGAPDLWPIMYAPPILGATLALIVLSTEQWRRRKPPPPPRGLEMRRAT